MEDGRGVGKEKGKLCGIPTAVLTSHAFKLCHVDSSIVIRCSWPIQEKNTIRMHNYIHVHTYIHKSCSAPFTIKTRPTVHFSVSTEVEQLLLKTVLIKTRLNRFVFKRWTDGRTEWLLACRNESSLI